MVKGISIPEFKPEIQKEYKKIMESLKPIKTAGTIGGHIVNAGESVKRKFNQIIDLFKTGKWAREDQVRVKIERDLVKVMNSQNEFSDTLKAAEKTKPEEIRYDYDMRSELEGQLVEMQKIVRLAEQHIPGAREKLETLDQVLGHVIRSNHRVLEEEQPSVDQYMRSKPLLKDIADAGEAHLMRSERRADVRKEFDSFPAENERQKKNKNLRKAMEDKVTTDANERVAEKTQFQISKTLEGFKTELNDAKNENDLRKKIDSLTKLEGKILNLYHPLKDSADRSDSETTKNLISLKTNLIMVSRELFNSRVKQYTDTLEARENNSEKKLAILTKLEKNIKDHISSLGEDTELDKNELKHRTKTLDNTLKELYRIQSFLVAEDY